MHLQSKWTSQIGLLNTSGNVASGNRCVRRALWGENVAADSRRALELRRTTLNYNEFYVTIINVAEKDGGKIMALFPLCVIFSPQVANRENYSTIRGGM